MDRNEQRCRVYVLCRPIFGGNNAQIRRQKKVKELVKNSKKLLNPLLKDIGETALVEIVRDLLENRIFESELRAKVEFPNLFLPSPLRDAQRQASEIDAERSAAKTLEEITSQGGPVEEKESSGHEDDAKRAKTVVGYDTAVAATGQPKGKHPHPLQVKLSSLYPSYLPYHAQHLILNTAQRVLEECCFSFAAVSMPSVARENNWDCPAAVELTAWTKIFRTKTSKSQLQSLPPEFGTEEMDGLLTSISNLRHTAVHRLPTTARGTGQLLGSAVKFAEILQDDLRAAQLEELRFDVASKIEAMELNKNVLESSASSQLKEIQRKREELDKAAIEVVQGMLKDDADQKALIGQLLKESVCKIFSEDKRRKEHAKQQEEEEEETKDSDLENGEEGSDSDDTKDNGEA